MNERDRQTDVRFPEPTASDDTYSQRGESTPTWLARSTIARATQCREFLNYNISKLPSQIQQKLAHDLRERWHSAFFELITARILQELGASLVFESANIEGKRPDFIAKFSDAAVVVEATAPVINQGANDEEKTRIPLLNIIETFIPRGWLVGVWQLPNIRSADSKKEFIRTVKEMLNLPPPKPDEIARELTATFPQGLIELQLFPTGKTHKRLGLEGTIAEVDNTQHRIRHALKRKRTQVRSSQLPAILAIEASGHSSDLEDFDTALFGCSFEQYDRNRQLVATGFNANGVFGSQKNAEPTYAAVLAFLTVGFNSCPAPALYIHPRSRAVLPKGLLQLEQRYYDNLSKAIRGKSSTVPNLTDGLRLVST